MLSSHRIDLLNSDEGIDCVMAHLTFKKFPQSIKNVILTLSSTHYPTFIELKELVPKAVDRIIKTNSNSTEVFSCNIGFNNKGANSDFDNKKHCIFCEKEFHFSSDCFKFCTYHDRINRLRELKRCSYCGRKGHHKKSDCGQLKCVSCK